MGKAMLSIRITQASDPKSNIQIKSITAEIMKSKPLFLFTKSFIKYVLCQIECAKYYSRFWEYNGEQHGNICRERMF